MPSRDVVGANSLLETLLGRVVLPAGDQLFRQRMAARLRYLEKAQWWSREAVHMRRDQLMAHLIRTTYDEVPFYRRRMDERGLVPADIQAAGDLARLPVLTKQDIRNNFGALRRSTGRKTYKSCSSGSTGEPLCVEEDSWTAGWYRASLLLALGWAGWRLGDKHLQFGMTLGREQGRRLKDLLLRCHYVSAFDLSDTALDAHLDLLDRRDIRFVFGYPVACHLLAKRAADNGWGRTLSAVVTWGDNLLGGHRRTIEDVFRTKVYDLYGCAEGFHVAAQCGLAGGYHVHSLDVVVEYVGEDGTPVDQTGRPAAIVVTRLHPGPMPLIRYRVGDVAVPGPSEPCPCGRGFDRMIEVVGREGDIVETPSGNRLIIHFFTGVLEYYPSIETFQIEQTDPARITLKVVPGLGWIPEHGERAITELKARGADLDIDLEVVGSLPVTSAGKHRLVVARTGESLGAD